MALTDIPGLTYTRTGSATAWRADGTLAEFAPNVPRITDRGVLIEGQRTNLAPRWDPNTAQVSLKVGCSDVGAPTIAPLSSRNWLALDNSTTAAYAYQSITVPASTQFTAQCLVETPDGSRPVCDDGSSAATDFSLYAGGAGLQGGVASYRRLVGNVWVISVTGLTLPAPNANFGPVRQATHSKRPLKFSGFQLERASNPSSPIITTGAPATRGQDNLVLGGLDSVLAAPFSLLAETEHFVSQDNAYPSIFALTGETSATTIAVYRSPVNGRFHSQIFSGGAAPTSMNTAVPADYAGPVKLALTFDGSVLRWAIAGGLAIQSVPSPFTQPLKRLHLFCSWTGDSRIKTEGKRAVILPYALTNAQLQAMTQ